MVDFLVTLCLNLVGFVLQCFHRALQFVKLGDIFEMFILILLPVVLCMSCIITPCTHKVYVYMNAGHES
jgi:hypothetical protein